MAKKINVCFYKIFYSYIHIAQKYFNQTEATLQNCCGAKTIHYSRPTIYLYHERLGWIWLKISNSISWQLLTILCFAELLANLQEFVRSAYSLVRGGPLCLLGLNFTFNSFVVYISNIVGIHMELLPCKIVTFSCEKFQVYVMSVNREKKVRLLWW